MVGSNSIFSKNVIKAFYIRIVSELCGKGLSINFSKKSDDIQSFVADFSRDWSEKTGLQVKSWSGKSEETWRRLTGLQTVEFVCDRVENIVVKCIEKMLVINIFSFSTLFSKVPQGS